MTLKKVDILRLMRESGLSAPYTSVKEFVRLVEARLAEERKVCQKN